MDIPLVLISAPAGYGKTTLLSTWLSQCPHNAAWISLDEGDNDLACFLSYLAAALQTVHAEIGKTVLAMLQSPLALPPQVHLTPLINDIAQYRDPFVLILDDYDAIHELSVHQAVSFLLDHLPSQLHLIISTRADPPLPLARLRAKAQMLEIRANDLCFTDQEARSFLRQSMGLSISNDEVATLAARTEGWIAGLQMAAVSMQGHADSSLFIRDFAGSNRYILDYLLEEVLERQSELIQSFLLKTSILNQLNGSLCDAVTGQTDGQANLEWLDRENLFVVSLDDQRCWYRYHHLFSDLLRQRLQSIRPDLVAALHAAASEWYEKNGVPGEAINHALGSGNFNRSANLVEKTADSTLMHGKLKTFLSWAERLTEAAARQHPLLCVYHAEALLLSGKPMVQVAKRLEGTPEYDAIQALVASYQGNAQLSQRLSVKALAHLPEESRFLKGVLTSSLGAVLMLSGDVEPAIQAFRAAADIGREDGNLMLEVIALSRLGQLHQVKGELQQAEGFIQKALNRSADRQGVYLPVASMPLMLLAYLALEWNNLNLALNSIQKAVELSQEAGGFWSVDCYIVYGLVLQAHGDTLGALEAIQKARQIASLTEANRFDDLYTGIYEARLCLALGNLDKAFQWAANWVTRGAEQVGLADREEPENGVGEANPNLQLYHLIELGQTTLAKIYTAQGKGEEALAVLRALYPETEKRGRIRGVIENLVLQAMAFQSLGKLDEALNVLETAFPVAEREGFLRFFLDEGRPMEQLLKVVASRRIAHPFVIKLLNVFGNNQTVETFDSSPLKLAETLSVRELEVLQLLAAGYSNREISGRLFISLSTVKGHAANIFGKLGVNNRTQAVARGREWGLIH